MVLPSFKYCLVAVLVSVLWWPLLQVAPNMRKFLGPRSPLEIGIVAQVVLFAIAGLTTAVVLRRLIVRTRGAWSVVCGAVLAFVTAEIFCVILVAYQTALGNTDVWHAVIWGPFFAAQAFYVVIPLGIASQLVMRKAAIADLKAG